jgi:hypothetical protein
MNNPQPNKGGAIAMMIVLLCFAIAAAGGAIYFGQEHYSFSLDADMIGPFDNRQVGHSATSVVSQSGLNGAALGFAVLAATSLYGFVKVYLSKF